MPRKDSGHAGHGFVFTNFKDWDEANGMFGLGL